MENPIPNRLTVKNSNDVAKSWYKIHSKEVKLICKNLSIYLPAALSACLIQVQWDIRKLETYEEIYEFLLGRKNCGRGITEEKMLFIYGEHYGRIKWEHYCHRQSITNTKEYKMKIHGMTSEEVDEYNKSRAVTKENLINRHGKEKGLKIWNRYIERQRVAGTTLDYFINKLGKEEGTKKYKEVNKKKSHTLDNYIKRYGEIKGKKKFEEHYSNLLQSSNGTSIEETKMFDKFDEYLTTEELEHSYRQFTVYNNNNVEIVDYVNTMYRFAIEYNGSVWHGNPDIYSPTDQPMLFIGNEITAKELWERDDKRIQEITEHPKIDKVFVIWDNEKDIGLKQVKEYVNECRNNR